jgi:hypothetical protein
MPYINAMDRADVEEHLAIPPGLTDISTGQLNYMITRLILSWLGKIGYHRICEAIGTLECVKLELYRRMAAPYEDKKCAENGDVYPGGIA